MKKPVFAQGNPKTGLAGSGDTSKGTYKQEKITDKMPRGEGQGQRPTCSKGK